MSYVCLKSSRLFTHNIMSKPLNLNNVIAYNVRLKKKEAMDVVSIIKTPIMKEGKRTGKFRYRLAGEGRDGTGMSRFINKDQAEKAVSHFGFPMEERPAKSGGRKKKTCKQIGIDAEARCNNRRAAKKSSSSGSAAKKSSSSGSAAKEPAAKKGRKAPAKKGRGKKR